MSATSALTPPAPGVAATVIISLIVPVVTLGFAVFLNWGR
jgi:hypothetical protein